ncbi:MAG TPA: co-chaperone GroES, partial [Nocardioidaceae bacterium]|nr:co-chaperone GroES [Nocardioidaceae bacterium]
MLHDRVLVQLDKDAGERRSSGGIVIPATAALGARRLSWCRVVAVGA